LLRALPHSGDLVLLSFARDSSNGDALLAVEPQAGVIPPSHIDHRGREIDAESLNPALTQMGGDLSRPTPHIRDWPSTGGMHQVGEQCEGRSFV
jgi:hypothetical protein